MKTRAQSDLLLAEKLVQEVKQRQNEKVSTIYGGLCHSFPVLVRTCGLCQALAFSQDKATGEGDRAQAHNFLLQHVGKLLASPGEGEPGTQWKAALDRVQQGDAMEYLQATRRVLAAWIYFKRFAVSILKVQSPRGAEDGS
jgi:CRISPR-associated protein Cmr5